MNYIKGNLLEAHTQALVNTVNTVGVMGKGIALQFKEAFPHNFKVYQAACKNNELQIGKLIVVKEQTMGGEKTIINFPTKTEWFKKSTYQYVEEGLKELARVIVEQNIESIAIPPLGCGNGGLKWDKVKPMMEKYLGHLKNVNILIYEPNEAIKEILKQQTPPKEIKLTQAKAMLLYAMFNYETLGEGSSLFVTNKLVYFLKRLGEKAFANLNFVPSHYGPYAVQVEHVLQNLNGKYIKGLEQMNVKAFEPLELQYDKFQEVRDFVNKELSPQQHSILTNLINLIDGFQSALALEILASVDFVMKENPSFNQEDIVAKIHSWPDRKKHLFKEEYILIAMKHLKEYSSKLYIH